MIVRDLQLTDDQQSNIRQLGRRVIARAEFVDDFRNALAEGRGYAAGRIGMSQKHWMCYPVLLSRQVANPKVYRLFETRLLTHGLKHEGVFPADPAFYLRYNEFYIRHVRNLDCVGLYLNSWDMALEKPIIDFFDLNNKFIHYVDLQPNRNLPDEDQTCYLPALRGKRVLLICPFASLLAARATQAVYEGIWSKLGKKWFYPTSVEALDIPYGFAEDTHARYPTAFEMYDDIVNQISKRDFDVALLGAGGLAIPLASHIKNMGKAAIDLGGHLQIVFGVIGNKWRGLEDYRAAYFNDVWIDMPAQYKPRETDVCYEYGVPGAFW